MRHNVGVIRSLAGPAAVAPVVKADAYGHGVLRTAEALAEVADGLCVATLDEAVALRAMLPDARVLLLYPGAARRPRPRPSAAGVELTIMSLADLEHLRRVAASDRPPVALQLVRRDRPRPRRAAPWRTSCPRPAPSSVTPRLALAGLWSHLASPADADASARQVERFERAVAALGAAGIPRAGASSGRQRPALHGRRTPARAGAARARRVRRARRGLAPVARRRRSRPACARP